jgi:molybdopterin molybdotransferase
MIELSEALNIILNNHYQNESEQILIQDALGSELAEDIIAPIDLPPFDASSMDGWAVNTKDESPLEIQGEIKAGNTNRFTLDDGKALKIFTGSALPQGANCVIRKEDIEISDGQIHFSNEVLIDQKFIRNQGNHVQSGHVVLQRGQKLNAAGIALIQHLGIKDIQIKKLPKVTVFITGDELQDLGNALKFGQIYESNSIMLESMLKNDHIKDIHMVRVKDTFEATKEAILNENKSDILIFSGGISVGDHDYVEPVLSELGLNTHFYKVRQKPGKPILFGELNHQSVFALPGNPASALVSYIVYIRTFLNGKLPLYQKAKLIHDYHNKSRRPNFARAIMSSKGIQILDGQDSHILKSFAKANALVLLEQEGQYPKGESLSYILFDL